MLKVEICRRTCGCRSDRAPRPRGRGRRAGPQPSAPPDHRRPRARDRKLMCRSASSRACRIRVRGGRAWMSQPRVTFLGRPRRYLRRTATAWRDPSAVPDQGPRHSVADVALELPLRAERLRTAPSTTTAAHTRRAPTPTATVEFGSHPLRRRPRACLRRDRSGSVVPGRPTRSKQD